MEKLSSSLLRVQGFYTLLASIFAFIAIDRFVPNAVDTVPIRVFSLILICASIVFIDGTRHNQPQPFLLYFPFVFATGMLALDVYGALTGGLPKIYLADVFPQAVFMLAWIQIFFKALRFRGEEKEDTDVQTDQNTSPADSDTLDKTRAALYSAQEKTEKLNGNPGPLQNN